MNYCMQENAWIIVPVKLTEFYSTIQHKTMYIVTPLLIKFLPLLKYHLLCSLTSVCYMLLYVFVHYRTVAGAWSVV